MFDLGNDNIIMYFFRKQYRYFIAFQYHKNMQKL